VRIVDLKEKAEALLGRPKRRPLVYFFLVFLAGADFDFLAGDCEDDFVDFLVALFIRSILPIECFSRSQ
jgi:hypothetical protein